MRPVANVPQQAWRLLIACDLYLAALGPGVFIVAVLGDWLGWTLCPTAAESMKGWDWAAMPTMWGPFATALGGCLVLLHLGRNRRRLHTAYSNWRTAWMARGFMIMTIFISVGCAVASISVVFPSWPPRLGIAWPALQVVGVLSGFATIIYTGMLLRSMKSITFWTSAFLPMLLLASAFSMGAMGVIMSAGVYTLAVSETFWDQQLIRAMRILEPTMTVSQAGLLVLYIRSVARQRKPEGIASLQMCLSGSWRHRFWGGVVGLALALPLFLDLVNSPSGSLGLAMLGAASALVGGFMLRLGVLDCGIKETTPLYRYGQWRVQNPSQMLVKEAAGRNRTVS